MTGTDQVTEGSAFRKAMSPSDRRYRGFEARACVIRAILAYIDNNPAPYERKRVLEAFEEISNTENLRKTSGEPHTGASMLQTLINVSRNAQPRWKYGELFLKGSAVLPRKELETFGYTRVLKTGEIHRTTRESSLSTMTELFSEPQEHEDSMDKSYSEGTSVDSDDGGLHRQPESKVTASDQPCQLTPQKGKREIAETPGTEENFTSELDAPVEYQHEVFERPTWSPISQFGHSEDLAPQFGPKEQYRSNERRKFAMNSCQLSLERTSPARDAKKMAKSCDLSSMPYLKSFGSTLMRPNHANKRWSEKQIRDSVSSITNAIDDVVTLLFESLGLDYNECHTARPVLLDPDPPLLSLYQTMFQENRQKAWRSTWFEVDYEAAKVDRIPASQLFRALVGAYIYHDLINGRLPWTTWRKLIANMGMSAVWIQSELDRRGVDLQDALDSAIMRQIEDPLYDEVLLSKAAEELADDFRCVIKPHLEMLKEASGQSPDKVKSARWYCVLGTEVFREVIKLKTHLEAAREDYYLTWHPRGTNASMAWMYGVPKAQESRYQVTMTLFPGIFISEETNDGYELKSRSRANVCLELRPHT